MLSRPSIIDVFYLVSKTKKKGDCYLWKGTLDDPLLRWVMPDQRSEGRSCGNSLCLNPAHVERTMKVVQVPQRFGRPRRSLEEVLASAVSGYPDRDVCWSSPTQQVSYNGGVCSLRDLVWFSVTGVNLPLRPKFLLTCSTPRCLNPRHAKPGQPGINYGSLVKEHEAEAAKRVRSRKF